MERRLPSHASHTATWAHYDPQRVNRFRGEDKRRRREAKQKAVISLSAELPSLYLASLENRRYKIFTPGKPAMRAHELLSEMAEEIWFRFPDEVPRDEAFYENCGVLQSDFAKLVRERWDKNKRHPERLLQQLEEIQWACRTGKGRKTRWWPMDDPRPKMKPITYLDDEGNVLEKVTLPGPPDPGL